MGNSLNQLAEATINNFLFQPPKNVTEENYNSLNTEFSKLVEVKTDSGKINFLFITPKILKVNKFIVYSYGNGCTMYHMYTHAMKLCNELGVYVVLYDYCGYGLSKGVPSEIGCYDSIVATIDYCKINYGMDENNTLLIGQSLGSGVVVHYAKTNNWPSAIILISPFKSIVRVITENPKLISLPTESTSQLSSLFWAYDKFNNWEKIVDLKCRVKIFHGINDNLINKSHSEDICRRLKYMALPATYFENTGHNDILEKIEISQINEILNTINTPTVLL
jgi:abhydrolase domain-containing protein 17